MMQSNESRDRDLAGFGLLGREVARLESFSDTVVGWPSHCSRQLDVPRSFNNLYGVTVIDRLIIDM